MCTRLSRIRFPLNFQTYTRILTSTIVQRGGGGGGGEGRGGEGVYGIYGGICDIWNPPDVFASYGLVKLMSCLYVNLCGRV